ncbi:type IV toxin-antitoxin system AbiEi family antitoxin [Rheinheimera texasensis]|uniref:type IV toxin-antitoxin system AbiEi family antitoxin n=1 Tax=Rheinheimera texasensis TaxID=306205 RepID=UPI000A070A9C|nr:type IV toxin-antitoxin system AbiEi family antitoxin [Rheinheimera texasensis]
MNDRDSCFGGAMSHNNEADLLRYAVSHANDTYKLGLQIEAFESDMDDARVRLNLADSFVSLVVEVKRWANHIDTDLLLMKLSRKSPIQNLILVAQYINPKMAERFRDAELQFIDTVGNIYLRQPGHFLFVTGNKEGDLSHDKGQSVPMAKALSAKALVVMYTILKEPDALKWSYRMFSEKTSVSIGMISQVMRELEQQGYLTKSSTKVTSILQPDELLQRWTAGYMDVWRKFRSPERWVSSEPFWQDEQQLSASTAVIGGEIAASHYLNYLTPGSAMFYATRQEIDSMARTFRLRKARTDFESGYKISFMEPMMPKELLIGNDGYAHPLLAYAELMASKDPRNIDTAKRLYDRYFGH